MSLRLTEDIKLLLQELIVKLSGFKRDSKSFQNAEKLAYSHVDSYHYFFTDNRNGVEKRIDGLCEKFNFHGFVAQAADLKLCAQKFLDSSTADEDLRVRLAIIKFLTEISQSPTTYFSEHPEEIKIRYKDLHDDVDWSKYLNETKVPLRQTYVESSEDEWSDIEQELSEICERSKTQDEVDIKILNNEVDVPDIILNSDSEDVILDSKRDPILDVHKAVEILRTNIQTHWWNEDHLYELPDSGMDEAEVAIRWDQYVDHATMGLCNQKSNIISEYKIMREIIWQFFETHSCFSFKFSNNELVIKDNLTVASVRPVPFKNFLSTFLPYFSMLKTFREFKLFLLGGEYFTPSIPGTFRSYNCAIEDILKPVFKKIMECEDNIRRQESTYTLLTLAKDLRPHFQKVEILHDIHNKVMKYFSREDDSFSNTTYLLSLLYSGLLDSSSKVEQNIYLTLYLESLYKYFTTIEMWLTQDVLQDFSDEFIIMDKSHRHFFEKSDIDMEFEVRKFKNSFKIDGMLQIISTTVFQLGKNSHLLKKLGKSNFINENEKESLHKEYCKMVLAEMNKYVNKSEIGDYVKNGKESKDQNEETLSKNLEQVQICPETPKSKSGMDDLSNFVDVNDPFLMPVFEKYFFQQEIKPKKSEEKNLYELIDGNIDRLVPVWQILENKFRDILKKRYGVPGLMVKDILIRQYNLDQHFSLLRRLFLFEDDIIFPFYKKMFSQFEAGQAWGNFFWLTSHLHDLLMDHYPDFYENCRVDVSQNWRHLTNPLEAWDEVSVHYKITWPINLIIQETHMGQYLELFKFILKLKWAMYTLNGLNFSDIQPRNKKFINITPFLQHRIRRLQLMRFRLLNDVSSVQHYILGHLFSTVLKTFNKQLEESCDLDTIIESHNVFVNSMYSFCQKLRDHDSDSYGFAKVLVLVKHLQNMWKNISNFSEKLLKDCETEYLQCNRYLRPIIQVDILF